MDTAHNAYTQAHYTPRAQDYLHSAVHAEGDDLDQVEAFAARLQPAAALDIGCGGGHVSYRLARHAGAVIACDITGSMLATVQAHAAERGLGNITTRQAAAEQLPLADAAMDAVLSRFSAHHWSDLAAGLREARRVLKPGGSALFIDTIAPAAAALDTHLQTIELLRDASHARNYRAEQWLAALAQAGFAANSITPRRLRMDFAAWVARTRTPDTHIAALTSLQQNAAPGTRRYFAIEPDGSFLLDSLAVEARPL